jgi:hypothetical protein
METCLSQRLTDEESPESRMREIRPSGLMRGGDIAAKLTTAVSSIRPRSLRPLYPNYTELHRTTPNYTELHRF